MTLIHPGKLFLKAHGQVEDVDDVLGYVEFLRRESGLDGEIPVDISKIYNRFQIPYPKQKPLPGIQGMLVDAQKGIIVINADDPACRQKFSQAHELIEFLFSTLPKGINLENGWILRRPGGFKETVKEELCDKAAANLIMPVDFVERTIGQYGVTFECAREIAKKCEVSLTAALIQVAQLSQGRHSVVMWAMKNKLSQIRHMPQDNQLGLFDDKIPEPVKKLRVEWSKGNRDSPYIPNNKSVEVSSLVYSAWESGTFTSGKERICLDGKNATWYHTQNQPFQISDERRVLSMIEHLD